MKKLFCLLMVLVLLLSAGCAKKDDILTGSEGVVENPVDAPIADEQEVIDIVENPIDSSNSDESEELDTPEVKGEENKSEAEKGETETDNKEPATPEPESQQKKRTVEQMIAEDHPELGEYLKDKEYIIVQAKKNGKNNVVIDSKYRPYHYVSTRMKLEITKVYQGAVKTGDIIDYWELLGEYALSDDEIATYLSSQGLKPIEDDTEYLMVIELTSAGYNAFKKIFYQALTGDSAYYTYIPISEQEAIAQRVKDGTATKYDQFHYALLEGLVA